MTISLLGGELQVILPLMLIAHLRPLYKNRDRRSFCMRNRYANYVLPICKVLLNGCTHEEESCVDGEK